MPLWVEIKAMAASPKNEREKERRRRSSAVGICLIQSVKEHKNMGKCVSSELQGEEKKIRKRREIKRNF